METPRGKVTLMSERKEQAIYNAVHEEIMKLRVHLCRANPKDVDTAIAQAGHAAGMAAIAAYRKPLLRKSRT
jgi:hypothetical protein